MTFQKIPLWSLVLKCYIDDFEWLFDTDIVPLMPVRDKFTR